MATLANLAIFACLLIPLTYGQPQDHSELFLTPLIKGGSIAKAKELAADHMKQFHIKSSTNPKLTSFSGYLTIDEATNSNIFFWFFPALENAATAPVIMSMNEAAGFSCLGRVFADNGPFRINEKLELRDNKHSWVNKYSLLFMDAPVGTGFSFTDSPGGYANKSTDDALEITEALNQFFTLFPEFVKQDFYMTGKIDYDDAYYAWGLVDEKQKLVLKEQVENIRNRLAEKKFVEAHQELFKIIVAPGNLYTALTGLSNFNTILRTEYSPEFNELNRFLDEKEVHQYLHAGFHKFEIHNMPVHDRFRGEIMEGDGSAIERVLENYKVLFYTGQFDPNHVPNGVTAAVEALRWSGSNGFKGVPRKIWRVGAEVAGYARKAGKATYVLVRNSGRHIMMDQPQWGFELVQNFIDNKPF